MIAIEQPSRLSLLWRLRQEARNPPTVQGRPSRLAQSMIASLFGASCATEQLQAILT